MKNFNFDQYWDITKNTKRAKEYFENALAYNIGPSALKYLIENDLESFNLIDVRKYEDYIEGHIPYATHVPFDKIYDNWKQFTKDKPNILCSSGPFCHLAKKCAAIAADHGYPVMELSGGFKAWKKHDYEIIKDAADMG